MIGRIVLAVVACSQFTNANAQDIDTKLLTQEASKNMAQEYVTCAAFYAVGARCFAGDKDPSDREHMQRAAVLAMRRAAEYADKVGINLKDTIESYRFEFDGMAEKINTDCQKLEILISEHGERCKLLMSHSTTNLN